MSGKQAEWPPEELTGLDVGDMIEGGSFMEALDPAELVYTVQSHSDRSCMFDVHWLGVHLGRFCYTEKGVTRHGS